VVATEVNSPQTTHPTRESMAERVPGRRTHGIYVGATVKGCTWEQARNQCRHALLVVALFRTFAPDPNHPGTVDTEVILIFRRIHEWILPAGWVLHRALLGVQTPRDRAKPDTVAAFARRPDVHIHVVGTPLEAAAALSLPLQTMSQVDRDIEAHKPLYEQVVKKMRELESLRRTLERREGQEAEEVIVHGRVHTSASLYACEPDLSPTSTPLPPLPHVCNLPCAPANLSYARRQLRANMASRIVPRSLRVWVLTDDTTGEATRWWSPWARLLLQCPVHATDADILQLAHAAKSSGDFDILVVESVMRCSPMDGLYGVACQMLMGCVQEQSVREFAVYSERARSSGPCVLAGGGSISRVSRESGLAADAPASHGSVGNGLGMVFGDDGAVFGDDGAVFGDDGAVFGDDGAVFGDDGAVLSKEELW
jgi:hypothetical protein